METANLTPLIVQKAQTRVLEEDISYADESSRNVLLWSAAVYAGRTFLGANRYDVFDAI